MAFTKIEPADLSMNAFKAIGADWCLITAGEPSEHNTMTASWGQMGVMWGKNVFTCMIRPARHTYGFVERNDVFTVSFFGGKHRESLSFCGSNSGRDFENKAKEAGLTPVGLAGATTFEEAEIVFVCRKIYRDDMRDSAIIDSDIRKHYAESEPFHTFFAGEIIGAYFSA